jgi:hypothetical protein
MTIIQQVLTGGEFETEADSWAHFDRMVDNSGALRMHKEVCGEYLQPRYDTEDKGARIDRILIPLQKAIEAGWADGAIGIEGKRSGMKIGKLISQAMDYTRCCWELKHPPGMLVMVRWVFVFPVDNPKGDLESLMAQNRIGYITPFNRRLAFSCGASHGIVIHDDGQVEAKQLPMGRKRGSR